ncbi:CPBP family intramembrane metalloprotease [Nocardiopsis exhalans]|uniref:CPBP family intramembrane metalloprotease n=1 Tax=Nocardiopsis exhalans TaxID=163604 RepID=A0ABY5D6M8_9ACTN|nr:CPBP family intramembrane glutamic endopeptidase [Nocardiopsis exhalans]USY19994.1 CPBP family intramembrane metalloprotease [Nocardiopsis exhalans]
MNHEEQRPPATPPTNVQTPPMAPPPVPPVPQKRRGPRPVPPGREYHQVLTGEKRQIWRGIAALVLLMGGMLVFAFGFTIIGFAIDALMGRGNMFEGEFEITPVNQAAGLLGLAMLLPWSMLIQRWLYGVRGASLHSVRSLFRPEVFGRSLMIILPIWVVYMTVFTFLAPYEQTDWLYTDLVLMFAVVMLLAPLQSAGEEYGFRGLAFRVAASWGRGPRAALILGVVVSSLLFMVAHAAFDPWLNLYYFVFGATLALISWRTGGLELAVVIHAVNNTVAFLLVLATHTDLAEGMDRSAGVGSPVMLLPCVLLIAITAVVWFRTRHTGPPRTPAPQTPEPESAQGPGSAPDAQTQTG